MVRLLTAFVLAPLVWVLLRYAPAWAFQSVVVAVITGGLIEAYGILRARGSRPLSLLGVAMAWGIAASFLDYPGIAFDSALPVSLGAVAVVLAAMARRGEPAEMLDAVALTLFPVLLVGATLAHLLPLRDAGGERTGRELVFLLFLCVTFGDTAAYYVGSKFGRRRIAPRLSPKKSLEGAVAAVVASVLAAHAVRLWFWRELPAGHAWALGVLLAVSGIFGDLAESLLKRAAGVKDSSRLLPGHGGILDRTDGLLFASPVLYYYYRLFLAGVV